MEKLVLRGHQDQVIHMVFSLDGQRIASASWDKTLFVWDLGSGAQLADFSVDYNRGAIDLSADGRRIAVGMDDGSVRVRDVQSGDELAVYRGHGESVGVVAFSPDNRRIASGARNGTARVWDAETGREQVVFRGHERGDWRDRRSVSALSFSPDGRRIASGGDDMTVRIWQAETGSELALLTGHETVVDRIAFSPDGRRVASQFWRKTLRGNLPNLLLVWDAETCECVQRIEGETDLKAAAADPLQVPFRGVSRDRETVIERADSGVPIHWFPATLKHIAAHPRGRTWAGASGSHLYIITLEGVIEPEK